MIDAGVPGVCIPEGASVLRLCQRWKVSKQNLQIMAHPSQLSHRAVKPDAFVGGCAEVSELLLTAAPACSSER